MNFLSDLLAAWGNGQTPWAQEQMARMGGGGMPQEPVAQSGGQDGGMMAGAMPHPAQAMPKPVPMPMQHDMRAGSSGAEGMSRRPPAALFSGPEQVESPSLATYASGALRGASQASNPIGAILGAVGGAMGAGDDVNQRNQTYQLLVKRGVPETDAALAVKNPPYMQQLLAQMSKHDAPLTEMDRADLDYKKAQTEHLRRPQQTQNEPVRYGFTPQWTVDGKPYVTGTDGNVKFLELPEGQKPLAPGELAADKAKGAATGKAVGAAAKDYPRILQNASETLGALEALEQDPYLDNMLGAIGGRTPDLTPSANRVKARMDEIGGKAFLTAFQSLKGGGQITEIEGAKATAAISRLGNRLQGAEDYRAAIQDLKHIATNGLLRAKVDAGELPREALSQLHSFNAIDPSLIGGNPAATTGGGGGTDGGWSAKKVGN